MLHQLQTRAEIPTLLLRGTRHAVLPLLDTTPTTDTYHGLRGSDDPPGLTRQQQIDAVREFPAPVFPLPTSELLSQNDDFTIMRQRHDALCSEDGYELHDTNGRADAADEYAL